MSNRDHFKKGSVEMLVLYLLQEDDMYGYQLTQLISERSDGILNIPEGSLYPTLYRLLEKGYISDSKRQVGKRLVRVYYHLEPSGNEYLTLLLGDYYRVNQGINLILTSRTENEDAQ